jgi:signal transduction histidine kinase
MKAPGPVTPRKPRPLLRATLGIGGISAALAGLAVLDGWPYWQDHQVSGAIAAACSAGLGVAGALMLTDARTRKCGIMLVAVGALWSATWSQSWNTGPFPAVGQYAQSLCFLVLGMAILEYLSPGRPERLERWWFAAAALILVIGTTASLVVSRPEWMGYRPGVFWPALYVSRAGFGWVADGLRIGFIAVALGYGYVLLRLARRKPMAERLLIMPMLLAVAALAVLAALSEQGSALTSLDGDLNSFAWQSSFGVLFLAVLLFTGLRNRVSALLVKNSLMSLAAAPTMSGIRSALAGVLHDPRIEVYYRLRGSDYFVDSQGRPAGTFDEAEWALRSASAGPRWYHRVFTDGRGLAAILDLDRRLEEGRGHLAAAESVVKLLLMHSDLRAELREVGIRLHRQAQIDILQTDFTERQRIERDLHDGAQQMLLALSMRMGAAAATLSDEETQDLVARWRRDVRDITTELRNLARGIYPSALSEHGLRAALESIAERQTELHVVLDVPGTRFPEAVETNLYFSVAELVANVGKHSGASRVRVQITHTPPGLACVVADDGNGGAKLRPGGGLEGLVANRIRALGGTFRIAAVPGEGSTIEMVVPCE